MRSRGPLPHAPRARGRGEGGAHRAPGRRRGLRRRAGAAPRRAPREPQRGAARGAAPGAPSASPPFPCSTSPPSRGSPPTPSAPAGASNLLAFPLLALLAWNFAVYAALACGPLLARRARWPRAGAALARAACGSPSAACSARLPRRRAGSRPRSGASPASAARSGGRSPRRALAPAVPRGLARLRPRPRRGHVRAGPRRSTTARAGRAPSSKRPRWRGLLGCVLGPAAHLLDALRGAPLAAALLSADSVAALRAPEGDGRRRPGSTSGR